MAVYVDQIRNWPQVPKAGAERFFGNGKPSCHMFCDGNLEELHQLAVTIGLKRSWFQRDPISHYDVTPRKRILALRHGAKEREIHDGFSTTITKQPLQVAFDTMRGKE